MQPCSKENGSSFSAGQGDLGAQELSDLAQGHTASMLLEQAWKSYHFTPELFPCPHCAEGLEDLAVPGITSVSVWAALRRSLSCSRTFQMFSSVADKNFFSSQLSTFCERGIMPCSLPRCFAFKCLNFRVGDWFCHLANFSLRVSLQL